MLVSFLKNYGRQWLLASLWQWQNGGGGFGGTQEVRGDVERCNFRVAARIIPNLITYGVDFAAREDVLKRT